MENSLICRNEMPPLSNQWGIRKCFEKNGNKDMTSQILKDAEKAVLWCTFCLEKEEWRQGAGSVDKKGLLCYREDLNSNL